MVTSSSLASHRPLLIPRDRFVGRVAEQTAIHALLDDPRVPLVTLTGPAGVGKTRLALRVAEARQGAYRDGVGCVRLWRETSPDAVLAAIARELRLPERNDGSLFERLVDHLRPRGLLLVLDGMERLVEAGPIVADLLTACPDVQALATSRPPLRVSGERESPIGPLAIPAVAPAPTATELAVNESVALFLERARSVDPTVVLTERTAAAIAGICRHLDGLPLAIELAAVRTRVLSLTEVRDRLSRAEGRLDFLESGSAALPERHRSLRNALVWSYDCLPLPARVLFRRLAVCEAGWTLELAAGLLRSAPAAPSAEPLDPAPSSRTRATTLDALMLLLDHGLVRRTTGGDGETRYAMFETVRDFALDRLSHEGDRRDAERRHAAGCLALAEAAASGLDGPDQAVWLRRLAAERANLSAALTRLQAAGDAAGGLRLAAALGGYWATSGRFDEARWLDVFLDLAGGAPADPTLAMATAQALRWTGQIAALQGQHKRAIGALHQALCRFKSLGEPRHAAIAAGELGVAYVLHGSPESIAQSVTFLEQTIDLHRERGETRRAAALQVYLGYAVGRRWGAPLGTRLIEEAEEAVRSTAGDHRAELGLGLLFRGWLALIDGDRHRATALLTECRTLTEALGCVASKVGAAAGLGWAALLHDDRAVAIRQLGDGLTCAERTGFRPGLTVNLAGIVTFASRGRADRSRLARLIGAIEALGADGRVLLAGEPEAAYRQELGTIRAALGSAEFDRERAAGQRLPLERIVADARNLLETPPAGGAPAPGVPRLTPREGDVLRLLAERLMNQEIADQLGMKVRTVETHVQHLCDKLGVTRRRDAVTRARELGLL